MKKEDVEIAARSLIRGRQTNLGLELDMPIAYPDGSLATVFVAEANRSFYVHDNGMASQFLVLSNVRFDKKLRETLSQQVDQFGCELVDGRVSASGSSEELPLLIALVANASRTIADEARNVHYSRAQSFRRKVQDIVLEMVGDRVRQKEEVYSTSGKRYRISNVLLDQEKRKPIAFIEAVPSPDVATRKVVEFLDLKDKYPEVACEAIYNDRRGILDQSDISILQKVANPVPWTHAKNRIKFLAA